MHNPLKENLRCVSTDVVAACVEIMEISEVIRNCKCPASFQILAVAEVVVMAAATAVVVVVAAAAVEEEVRHQLISHRV